MALVYPLQEYRNIGLPPEGHKAGPGEVSPLMYLKGIREMTFGTTLLALQFQQQETALTTVAAILSVTRLGDGFVVWFKGGAGLKLQAIGHWLTGIGFIGWVLCRTKSR